MKYVADRATRELAYTLSKQLTDEFDLRDLYSDTPTLAEPVLDFGYDVSENQSFMGSPDISVGGFRAA